ncbi:MAG: Outer-membrane lipoprotein carrier protein LolA [bacterium F082]|nr:MAG: Outer-membrane lipoprotein carrier protein LolA [bacterium F082]KWW30141.1 MAG: Outer-membrane lipoprotein carrier protein LolA [bacterium P201]
MKIKNIIACIALVFAAQVVSAQSNAEKIIRVMVDQMRSHKNVEMVFNYHISPDGKTLGESEKGHAWLQGEAYKIEMTDQQTISDGKTIWSYLIDDEEVMVSNASEGTDNTPLKLLTSLDESYVATLSGIDAKGIATIELANPKGQYKRVTMKVDTKKTELKSADIYLEDGNKFIIKVEEMKYDQKLDDKFFTFDEAKHPEVDVIDMR